MAQQEEAAQVTVTGEPNDPICREREGGCGGKNMCVSNKARGDSIGGIVSELRRDVCIVDPMLSIVL